MQAQMLAPAAVLVAWTLVVMLWMMATRLPAIAKSGIDLKKAKPGGRGQDLEGVLPDRINWKGHNYVHLMEQPTLFYAVALALSLEATIGASELRERCGDLLKRNLQVEAHCYGRERVQHVVPAGNF